MRRRGMTYQQIADALSEKLGHKVPVGTVASSIHRAGLSEGGNKKYRKEIPWTVRQEHQPHYAARMLRVLGRRNAGLPNNLAQDKRLDSWLTLLRRHHAVVTYVRDTDEGFFYVSGRPNPDGIPIIEEVEGL